MLIQSLDVTRYVKASAGRASLRVVFENENKPRHDGNTIYLPKITRHTTQEEIEEIMSSTDHEVAHDLYSDFTLLQEKKIDSNTSPLGFIWNFVEDSRVNAIEAKEYAGFRELWDKTSPKLLENIESKTRTKKEIHEIVRSLIKWDTNVSSYLFPNCELAGKTYTTDEKIDAILKKFSDALLVTHSEIRKKEGSLLTYELAREIFRALGGDPDKEEARSKEAKSGKESTEGEKTETKKKDAGDGEEAEGKEEEDWCVRRIDPEDSKAIIPSIHNLEEIPDEPMSKVGLLYKVSMAGDPKGRPIANLDDFIVVDFCKKKANVSAYESLFDLSRRSTSVFKSSFNTRVKDKSIKVENFAQQVRRLIQIRSKVKYEYGVKKGKLDYCRLARLALKTPGFSERIFKNKINNSVLNAAVTILIDMSGSMSGDKVFYATEASILLNEIFSILNVSLEILGFTDTHRSTGSEYCKPISYIYKSFSTVKISEDDLLDNIASSSSHMMGNDDGDSILWAYDRLLKRKEKKRILIVMSDGQPCTSASDHDIAPFTHQIIKEIEKAKKVEIYGLGLCDESVSNFYKNNSTIERAAHIPQKLLELIERKVLND